MLWLRPEQPRVVDWGGDPHNAKIAEGEGPAVRISPRKSFEKWQEVVRGRSAPWLPWHGITADRLRHQITGLMLGRSRRQIAIAESLQRAVVLDEAPEVPGLEVLARYLPAEGGQLGGDWWDVLPLDGDRVAVVVGDVAGHGVHAAAAMAQLRTAVRAYLLEGHSPAAALERLDTLVGTMPGGHTATAVVGIVDHRGTGDGSEAVVELASAGHLPPLLVSAEGTTALRVPPRPVLGLGFGPTTGVDGEDVRVPLPAGAVLLLHSDGLVERRDAGLEQTTAALAEAATRAAGELLPDPERGMAAVVDRLLTAVPGGGGDDTTLVLLRRR